MQNEITGPQELLDGHGRVITEGWARRPYWRYDRRKIAAGWHRIKEWDYYSVLSHGGRYGITLTASDLGYAGLFAICWLDFDSGFYDQVDTLSVLPRGRTGFPATSADGVVEFGDRSLRLRFEARDGRRVLRFAAPMLRDGRGATGLTGEIELTQPPHQESMAIATSWAEKRTAFYYNEKINCMPAAGSVAIGDNRYPFHADRDFGALDWGRGRWTYTNRWYWSSASGYVDGRRFGWNLGYGFSDRSPATENVVFVDGRAHKLDQVVFEIDTDDYTRPWTFASNDGRFEMEFSPIVDRASHVDFLVIKSTRHQVFGHFRGFAMLDDGTRIEVRDFLGFAEDVFNRW